VTIVVDASAVVAMLFDEPSAQMVRDRIVRAALVAPALLAFEIANVCVVRQRRRPTEQALAGSHYALFQSWDIAMLPVEHAEVVALATATGLTAYDASYLWLARRLGADLVTLDRRLIAATPPAPAPRTPG
jgi:predicted nucleic acid-binding protein